MKGVVDRRVRYRPAFIYHVRKEDVPESVTTPITSVIKNHDEPGHREGQLRSTAVCIRARERDRTTTVI